MHRNWKCFDFCAAVQVSFLHPPLRGYAIHLKNCFSHALCVFPSHHETLSRLWMRATHPHPREGGRRHQGVSPSYFILNNSTPSQKPPFPTIVSNTVLFPCIFISFKRYDDLKLVLNHYSTLHTSNPRISSCTCFTFGECHSARFQLRRSKFLLHPF